MCSHDSVVIDVSTDGVNAFGFRCKAKFWPILGCLAGDSEPFIIGCFFGKSKPGDLQTFLADFSAEVAVLLEDGVFLHGKRLDFSVRDYIMNAEARAFVKCIIKHNGKEGCEKCCTRGKHFLGRMVFTNLNAALRTDLSFRNREHPRHHKRNASPLELIGTNMISQFALDGLHLVYLGVFQRWLNFILKEDHLLLTMILWRHCQET